MLSWCIVMFSAIQRFLAAFVTARLSTKPYFLKVSIAFAIAYTSTTHRKCREDTRGRTAIGLGVSRIIHVAPATLDFDKRLDH